MTNPTIEQLVSEAALKYAHTDPANKNHHWSTMHPDRYDAYLAGASFAAPLYREEGFMLAVEFINKLAVLKNIRPTFYMDLSNHILANKDKILLEGKKIKLAGWSEGSYIHLQKDRIVEEDGDSHPVSNLTGFVIVEKTEDFKLGFKSAIDLLLEHDWGKASAAYLYSEGLRQGFLTQSTPEEIEKAVLALENK